MLNLASTSELQKRVKKVPTICFLERVSIKWPTHAQLRLPAVGMLGPEDSLLTAGCLNFSFSI